MFDKDFENALIDCFDLWLWKAANVGAKSSDWPGWESNGGWVDDARNHCPICEYVLVKSNMHCDDCIIDWSPVSKCTDDESLLDYAEGYKFSDNKLKSSRAALEIATRALDRLFWEMDNEC